MYVSNSQVVSQRSWWTPSGMADLFWAIVSFLYLFAKTLVSPGYNTRGPQYTRDYRRRGFGGSGGGGGLGFGGSSTNQKRIGRIGGGGGVCAPGSPPMAGGG